MTWLLERGDVDGAARWLDNLPPGSVAAIRVSTQRAIKRGRLDDATKTLKDLLAKPQNADDERNRLIIVAQVAEELGPLEPKMFGYADAAWNRLLNKDPNRNLDYAAFLIRRKDPAKIPQIVAACRRAYDSGNKAGAVQQALTALRAFRDSGDKWNKALSEVVTWLPQRGDADLGLNLLQDSEFAEIVGKFDRQEELLRKYLGDFPAKDQRRAIVLNNLAYLLAVRGHAEEATPFIDETIDILGPLGSVRDTKGMIELGRNKPKSALEEFQKSIEDDGPSAMKYYHLARAQLLLGNQAEAEESLNKSKELGLKTEDLGRLEIDTYKEFVKQMQAAGLTVQDITQAAIEKKL